ncbi:hypothetical protein [Methylobacterium planeticum]|uniref:Uncharacterized protein n=1 Tax=Methylobacterium planeticum TaxID=2615211 RepID=A0A6N6MIJ3_9HYPH|nr:hypothetical protein [Methylobacterium planeticum]KAB1068877.1 hypothetical protein F6X51_26095 [Methylobacterium planeticum]
MSIEVDEERDPDMKEVADILATSLQNEAIDGLAAQIAGRDAESPWQGRRRTRTKREKTLGWQTRFPRAAAAHARKMRRAKTIPAQEKPLGVREIIQHLMREMSRRAHRSTAT